MHGFALFLILLETCKLHKGQATYGAKPGDFDNSFVKILIWVPFHD